MNSFRHDASGQAALIFGLLAPVLVAAMAVAIDYSDGSNLKSDMQSTADSAALAGAVQLLNVSSGASQTQAAAKQRAADFASAKSPEASQAISVTSDTVKVGLTRDKSTFFGGVLGQQTIPIAVRSVATLARLPQACMLALGANEPIGIGLVGSAKINAPGCLIQSNSTSATSIKTQGAASVSGWKVCSAGGLGANSSPPPQQCTQSQDPFVSRQLQNQVGSACDFLNTKITKSGALTPGIYCNGLSIQSSDVTFAPGLYIIKDGPLSITGNSTVTGNMVSILLAGNGAVLDMQGSSSITLVAMKTGALADIAIASTTPSSPVLSSSLQGSPKLNLTGSLYLPNQRLQLQGNPSLNVFGATDAILALSYDLQGSPEINIAAKNQNQGGTAMAGPRLSE